MFTISEQLMHHLSNFKAEEEWLKKQMDLRVMTTCKTCFFKLGFRGQ